VVSVILVELNIYSLGSHAKHAVPVEKEVRPPHVGGYIPYPWARSVLGRNTGEDTATFADQRGGGRGIVGEAVEVATELGTFGQGQGRCFSAGGSSRRGGGEDRDGGKELHFVGY